MEQATARNFDLLESPLEGTNLIEASAGTGKTSTLAALVIRLILEQRYRVDEILVVTYTVAATEELRDRIRRKIRGALDALLTGKSADPFLAQLLPKVPHPEEAKRLLQEALHDFDRASIFTIHGFCQRLLYEKAFETGSLFHTEFIPEEESNLKEEVVADFWRRHFYPAPLEMVNYARTLKLSPKFFLEVASQTRGHLDFDIVPHLKPVHLDSLSTFRQAVEDLERAWMKAREEVLNQLSGGALNLRQYANPEKLLRAMDAFLAGAGPKFPLFKEFYKFTAGKIKESTKKNQTTPRHLFFELAEGTWKKGADLKQEMDQQLLFLKGELFRYLSSELPRRKERRNIQSFDDLLIRVRSSLEKERGEDLSQAVRRRYRAALVDEFQDTDPTQYAIFQNIFGKPGSILFLIGDPKQAIYSFRGADLFAYLKAARHVRHRYTLTKNWRSGPELVKAVNTIFSRVEAPFLYEDIGFAPVESGQGPKAEELWVEGESEPPFHLWWVDQGKAGEAGKSIPKGKAQRWIQRAIAAEVARLVDLGRKGRAGIGSRPLQEEDMAILVRTNRQARIIQEALLSLRIPCVLHSTGYLFDTQEAVEMKRLLAGIAEPHSERLVRAALATDLLGGSGEEMDRLLTEESQWEDWLFRFREYYEIWEKQGFIRMFQQFLRNEKVRSRLMALPDGERRLTNVLHLGEVLNREAMNQKLGISRLWQWLAHQLDPSAPRLEEHLLRLESDARAVKIVTIHKSKGLEYPIVFCPFNWEGSEIEEGKDYLFHDPKEQGRLKLVLQADGNGSRALAQKELLAENLRLLYVSLTRARSRCYLVWGRFKDSETSALAYLLHPPQDPADDIVGATSSHFAGLSEEEILKDLEKLVQRSKGAIQFSDIPDGIPEPLAPVGMEEKKLNAPQFPRPVPRDWGIPSFSSLTSRVGDEAHSSPASDLPDYDQEIPPAEKAAVEEPKGILAFPKGARAGTFFHDIFEHIDFAAKEPSPNQAIVKEKLKEYGFAEEWEGTVGEMIRRVLTASLPGDPNNFSLSEIEPARRLNELEFYFPLQPLTPGRLAEIFDSAGRPNRLENFSGHLERLNFQPRRGFMKGFIDLAFEHRRRFYLIDWKSNFLGPRVEDYGPEALMKEMEESFYILQYHLYALALHRYLKWRLPDYSYGRDFGGVFYIFIRGVDPSIGSEFGIFHDRPPLEFIQTLEEKLIRIKEKG